MPKPIAALIPIAGLLLSASLLPAAVKIEEQGEFVKIKELDGAETLQLLFLRKRDISAVTYAKTEFNRGEMTLIMHYRDRDDADGGVVAYRIEVPPNADGETMAERVIRMIEAPEQSTVIKREYGFPPR